jgi:hypothetical protein
VLICVYVQTRDVPSLACRSNKVVEKPTFMKDTKQFYVEYVR